MAFVFEEEEQTPTGDFMAEEIAESPLQQAGRHVARGGARAAETVLGLPGDFLSLLVKGGTKAGRAIGLGDESSEERAEQIQSYLPTSEFLREKVTKPLTGKYLEPKGPGEELADEIVSDAASLLVPVKGPKGFKLGKRALKALGVSGGANLLSEFSGQLGAGEKGKAATKLGSMILLDAVNPGGAKRHLSKLYGEAEEAIKGGAKVSVPQLSKSLKTLKKDLKAGLEAGSEVAVLNKVQKLQDKIKNGQIDVKELWASKRSINEEMAKAIYDAPNKTTKARARNLFKKVNRDLNSELAKYGEKNTAFGKAFRSAEEGFATHAQSQAIGNFIKKNARYTPLSPLLYPIIHSMQVPGAAGSAGIAGGLGLYKGGQLAYRMAKSPTLKRYYANLMKSAAAQDAAAVNRNLKKLDDELTKTDEKEVSGRFVLED